MPVLALFLLVTPVVFADGGANHRTRQNRPLKGAPCTEN
jgi:hypothetical protein